MRAPLAQIVAAVVTFGVASTAIADPPTRIGVVIDTVDVPESVAGRVRIAAELTIRERQMSLVDLGDPRSGGLDPSELGACVSQNSPCARDLLAAYPVDRVVYIALRTATIGDLEAEAEGDAPVDLSVTARVFDAASGNQVAVDQRVCDERCQQTAEFSSFIRELTQELTRTELMIVTTRPAPAPEPSPANPRPPPQPMRPVPEDRPSRLQAVLPFASIGVGVAAVAGGITLVAIDGPRIENGERLREERATRTAGFVAIGAGVGLVGAGVALWVWKSDPEDGVRPAASIGSGRASVGITGRF